MAFLFGSPRQNSCGCSSKNFDQFHPHGADLYLAECQVERQDALEFKRLRSKIVRLLEYQYQQIVATSLMMTKFIKEEKTSGGIFSPSYREIGYHTTAPTFAKSKEVSTALALLENFVNAFKPDIPYKMQENLETIQCTFDNHPVTPPAQDLPTNVLIALREKSYYSFDVFKAAVDDLQTQYLKIRNARKELFVWDSPGETGCSVNTDVTPLGDAMIDWRCE